MRVLKRYRKVREWVDDQGKKRWETESKFVTRGAFAIPMDEPLAPIMAEWVKQSKDWLFPTPNAEKIQRKEPWLSRVRAYQIVREIGRRVGVHLYDHWFRAQRACQLASEYGFGLMQLQDWFGWKYIEIVTRYAKLSWRDLAHLMKPNWFKNK